MVALSLLACLLACSIAILLYLIYCVSLVKSYLSLKLKLYCHCTAKGCENFYTYQINIKQFSVRFPGQIFKVPFPMKFKRLTVLNNLFKKNLRDYLPLQCYFLVFSCQAFCVHVCVCVLKKNYCGLFRLAPPTAKSHF